MKTVRRPGITRKRAISLVAASGWFAGCRNQEVQDPLLIAAAANAVKPLEILARAFEEEAGVPVRIVSGSSGKLYAQVRAGAPYDVFFSADEKVPMLLEEEGLAVAGSRRTYAIGTLVLWSPQPVLIDGQGEVLKTGKFRHLAIANPETAPYGAAARQVLQSLGLWAPLRPKLVTAESVGQAYSFIASGNAELGFIALAQIKESDAEGSQWLPPKSLYEPIRQQVVVLRNRVKREAAQSFVASTVSSKGTAVWRSFGYDSE